MDRLFLISLTASTFTAIAVTAGTFTLLTRNDTPLVHPH